MNSNRVEELLSEILRWIKFAGAKEVRNVLTTTLDTDQKKLIYHLSDGKTGSVELAKAANTSDRTVRRYWETWSKQGIVDVVRVRGGDRYKKSFELEDFGIRLPQVSTQSMANLETTVNPVASSMSPGDDHITLAEETNNE